MVEIWGRRNSVNVQKALWAAAETGVPFERHVVGGQWGGTDDKAFRKLNPMGLVPVLKDGTIVVFESHAIVRHLARRHGRKTIQPRGVKAQALADQWMDWTATAIQPAVGALFMGTVRTAPDQRDPKKLKEFEKAAGEIMKVANKALGRKPFVAGRHFSTGDIPLGAVFWRYMNMDVARPKLPNLERWFESLKEREAYRQWVMVPLGRTPEEWAANEKKLG
ncbi:MAG: glutathione S-transferase family protein [Hyphomicrobiales bacterium]